MKIKILTAALLSSFVLLSNAAAQSAYTDADLVWSDDFSAKKLNKKNWGFEYHEPGWVNNELQSYGDSSKNTYVKDGCLVIQPIQVKNKNGTYSYTSGRINTQGKHHFKYGRMEARIKFPKGQGFLPAFWMMPADESFYGNWPKCGEIDIAEVLGNKTDTLYGTIHYGEPHAEKQGTYVLESGTFADDFHVVAVEWEPGEIRYYCDGKLYKTVNDWFTKKPGFGEVTYPAPFDQPFYLILNVAVGGNWPGNPDATTKFDESARMVVDYVKVYQKKSYNEDVEKPAAEKIVINKDSSGNLVKAGPAVWSFLTAGKGKGNLSVNGGQLAISTSVAGELDYSIQVVQTKMPMEQGKVYKYSFDAWADADRTMITGITAPNASYMRRFGDVTINLTSKKQHFEFTFNSLDASDPECRIEYNLGNQDSIATVYVENVRLEQTGDVDYSKLAAGVLPDGNYIKNGEFQEGKGRLGYWILNNAKNAAAGVTNDDGVRQFKVVNVKDSAADDVQLIQKDISLPAGKDFILRFEASSSKSGRGTVTVSGVDFEFDMTPATKAYEFIFKAPQSKIAGAVTFNLGAPGSTVVLDNVSLKENVLLMNGDFEGGMTGFEVYTHDSAKNSYRVEDGSEGKCFAITIDNTGTMDWTIQLKQNNVLLEKGKKYKVSLRAKSDMKRDIMYALQRDGSKDNNWDPYSGTIKFTPSDEWQEFGNEFEMTCATDSHVIFTISMGAVNDKKIAKTHTVYIDSIVVSQVEE